MVLVPIWDHDSDSPTGCAMTASFDQDKVLMPISEISAVIR
jgi:hypothetical protein